MTPANLLETLNTLPDDAPLVFVTDQGEIGDGYHVTEYKLSHVTSIDCGARLANWTEATLQLLDGEGGGYMAIGKFAAILKQSIVKVSGLDDAPLQVEFSHGNKGMRIFQVEVPELRNGMVAVRLREARAHCKPALEMAGHSETAGCCGAGSAAACCV